MGVNKVGAILSVIAAIIMLGFLAYWSKQDATPVSSADLKNVSDAACVQNRIQLYFRGNSKPLLQGHLSNIVEACAETEKLLRGIRKNADKTKADYEAREKQMVDLGVPLSVLTDEEALRSSVPTIYMSSSGAINSVKTLESDDCVRKSVELAGEHAALTNQTLRSKTDSAYFVTNCEKAKRSRIELEAKTKISAQK